MEDRVLRLSAALAYYAVFSIGPLLVLVVGVVGLLMGDDQARRQIHQYLQSFVGENSTGIIESMMAARQKGGSLLASIVGGVALLLGASGVFGQLQDSLNTIWEVQPKPGQGIWGFVRQRFLSMSMVLGVGFLLLLSMILTTVIQALANRVGEFLGFGKVLAQIANLGLSALIITLLFAAIFKILPDVEIRWRDVWVGAFVTALLFLLGQFVLGLYLGSGAMSSGFGAASAFVVILMYVYYASLILFFGAEFTQVYAHSRGQALKPSPHAVPVTEQAREQQGMPSREPGRRPPREAKPSPERATGVGPWTGATNPAEEVMALSNHPNYRAPVEQIRSQPWSFVLAGLGAGLAAGFFMKARTARKLLKYYLAVRRFV